MNQYRDYTDEDIIKYAKEVKSIAGLLRKLNLVAVGGNYYTIKKYLQRLKVDTSHWTGQGWNKGEQLKDWKDYNRVACLKKHLINLRGNQCEDCKNTVWKMQPIKLELHHVDGNRTNHESENLQLLCPNCHSCTPNFRRRKNKNS